MLIILLIVGGFLIWPMYLWLLKESTAEGNKQIIPLSYLTVYTGILIGYFLICR